MVHAYVCKYIHGLNSCELVANVLDCDIGVSGFKLQSRYYVQFQTYILENGIPTTARIIGLLRGWLWH